MELNKLDGDLEILVDYSQEPTVTLRGEVDFRNMARVKQAICSLVEHGNVSISVDVRELVFMDSTGLSALVDAARSVGHHSGEIRLVSPSAQLTKVLEKSGFSNIFVCGKTRKTEAAFTCPVRREMPDTVEFDVPGRPEMISHIRARVADFACSMPFTEDEIEDIKLAVGEASANALRHGSTPEWCRVGVRMEKRPDRLTIYVYDRGCGFDPGQVRVPDIEDMTEGGRGIMFMRALMDEVNFHFESPGTRVELVKRLDDTRH